MTEKKKKKAKGPGRARNGRRPDKINVPVLLDALEQHVLGNNKMTSTQVNAALALLKKAMPDLPEPVRKRVQDTQAATAHEDALQELE